MSIASMLGEACGAVVVDEYPSGAVVGVDDMSIATMLQKKCLSVQSADDSPSAGMLCMYRCCAAGMSGTNACMYRCCADKPRVKRKRKSARPPASRVSLVVASELLTMTCDCDDCCAFQLRSRVPDICAQIQDARLLLHNLGRARSSEFLFNVLLPRRISPPHVGGKYVLSFVFAGVSVCGKVWCELHGLKKNDSRIKRVFAKLRKGDSRWVTERASRSSGGRGWRGSWCRSWCGSHVKKFAEFDPGKQHASLDPEPLEVRHMLYTTDFQRRVTGSRQGCALKLSRFCSIWKEFVASGYCESGVKFKVRKRKPRSGFTCNLCQLLMSKRRKATTTAEREGIGLTLKQHLQQVTVYVHVRSTCPKCVVRTLRRRVRPDRVTRTTLCSRSSTNLFFLLPLMLPTKRNTIVPPTRLHVEQHPKSKK